MKEKSLFSTLNELIKFKIQVYKLNNKLDEKNKELEKLVFY